MHEQVVITDTSCLILLDKIHALTLLHAVYDTVVTTPEIAAEFGRPLPDWVTIIAVKDKQLITFYNRQVDLGKASAIALAKELLNPMLIIDDLKGRKLATQLSIRFTGTIGILIAARQKRQIQSLRPYFSLIASTDFRIAPALLEHILEDFKD